jgi:hypothetical protein
MRLLKFIFLCIWISFLSSCDTGTNPNSDINQVNNSKDSISAPDSAVVTLKKFTIKNKEGNEASFEYPLISGLPNQVADKINREISKTEVTEDNHKAIEKEFTECSCGYVGSSYKINFNENHVLSLSLFIETMGAYPGGQTKNLNFNLLNGELIQISDLLKKDSLTSLANTLNPMLEDRLDEAKKAADDEEGDSGDGGDDLMEEWSDGASFTKDNLNDFIIDKDGLTFYYDFAFPHAAEALEPDNSFKLTYSQLASYKNANSVIAELK